jgi:hypothetical protein
MDEELNEAAACMQLYAGACFLPPPGGSERDVLVAILERDRPNLICLRLRPPPVNSSNVRAPSLSASLQRVDRRPNGRHPPPIHTTGCTVHVATRHSISWLGTV